MPKKLHAQPSNKGRVAKNSQKKTVLIGAYVPQEIQKDIMFIAGKRMQMLAKRVTMSDIIREALEIEIPKMKATTE